MATDKKTLKRVARKVRLRKIIRGTPERPRLSVFKSSRYVYAQIIDDVTSKTVVSCSTKEKSFKGKLKSLANSEAAKTVGRTIAERAKGKNVKSVVFDRSGFSYHGRIKAIAEGAREAGLQF